MPDSFQDIRVVSLDEKLSARHDPVRTGMHDLHFQLSASAPSLWVDIANNELSSPWITAGRRVRASSQHLIAHCPPEEAQKILDAVKPIIERVNQRYQQWYEVEQAKRNAAEALASQQSQKVQEAKDKLKFD